MKPVYVVAQFRSQQSGWYIADETGMPVSGTPAFRDRQSCARAIGGLRA